MTTVLAIDLGKTSCRVRLGQDGAYRDSAGAGAPGLASPSGAAGAEAAILAVAAPLAGGTLDHVGVSVAGALTAPHAAGELAGRLCRSLPARTVAVTSDAIAAHAGALGGQPGIALTIGTGAVALAIGPDGVVHRADGDGPWLGDEGGGAWLGLAGLRAAARAADGRGPATALLALANARYGDFRARLEGSANPPRLAAEFAVDVLEADDPVAAALVRDAVAALAATVRAAARGCAGPLVILGGLADRLGPQVAAALGMPVQAAQGSALDGARLLALDRATIHEHAVHRAAATADAPDCLDLLATEAVRPGLDDLDQRGPAAVVALLLAAERDAQDALARAAPQLQAAAVAVAGRMLAGGRLFYLGAGTPGRLAVLDAAELGPTYSAPPELVVALLAGGPAALTVSAEGAEDDPHAAAALLDAHQLGPTDAVVGIAASGRTPYVVGGLQHARKAGALTVAVVNNPGSPAVAAAELTVEILTGAEVIAGSTRMTAGTVQKIALNAISTAAMVALGKTYGARMVDVRATNDKLRRRAHRIVGEITGAADDTVTQVLVESGGRVKLAVVALLAGVAAADAEALLQRTGGRVRDAVAAAQL